MTVQSFVPTIWAKKIQRNLNDAHVYAKCCNRDYEGEVRGEGSSVKINSIGRVTTFAVTRNTDITAAETLDTAGQYLIIDTARGFNFSVDDIDAKQAAGDFMGPAMEEAAWALADDADVYLATVLTSGAGLTVTAATVGTGVGETSLFDQLVVMDVALTETNTPRNNRWVVLPPWGEGMMRLDERFGSFGTSESNARLRGDPITKASGFNIYISNNVPVTNNAYTILGGYTGAATFAEQIHKVTAYDDPDRFDDAVKGLHVYGAKVTRANNIAKFVATKGTFA